MRRAQAWVTRSLACLLPVVLSACASMPRDASLPIDDPNEQLNRKIFAANEAVLRPPADVIKAVTPGPIHDRLHDLNANLKEPRIFANDILQLRFDAALKTAVRFVGNSIIGVGGLFDIVGQSGVPQQTGDFGQTLFVWGVPSGPYVVRPFYGPSTVRDSIGFAADSLGDPVAWALGGLYGWPPAVAMGGLEATVRLRELKQAEEASIDFYSFLRSDYYQTRRADLREAIGLPAQVESPATPSPR
jgi:phospholipid-binding lipoprotein MlaA